MGNNQNLGMTEDHGPGRTLFRPRRANLLQGLTLTIADLHPKQQTARKLGPPTDLSGLVTKTDVGHWHQLPHCASDILSCKAAARGVGEG